MTMFAPFNPTPICDFCSSPDIRWRYPARAFIMEEVPEVNIGVASADDWAACDVCHDLIEKGDRDALLARSVAHHPAREVFAMFFGEGIDAALREAVGEIHARFFIHRTGACLKEFRS